MVICMERGANDLHMVQLMPLQPRHLLIQQNPEWFILLVPAYPICPGKRPLNSCVCVCVFVPILLCEFSVERKQSQWSSNYYSDIHFAHVHNLHWQCMQYLNANLALRGKLFPAAQIDFLHFVDHRTLQVPEKSNAEFYDFTGLFQVTENKRK